MSKTDLRGRYDNRYRQHANVVKRGRHSPLYNAWRKHGAPPQTILSTHGTREACALAEIAAIQQYDSMNPERGYNLQPGGQGLHAPPGSAVYELMRAKVWNNPAVRRKLSEAFKDKPLSENTREAHRIWRESPEGKVSAAETSRSPEARSKLSASMQKRLANGYREYLSDVQKGVPRTLSPEGRARGSAARKAWLATEEGKATARKGAQAMRANPENEAKRKAAAAVHANSEANKSHCLAMSAAASKPVKDLATGVTYPSCSAAARALGVSAPTIGYWVKKGKFEYV